MGSIPIRRPRTTDVIQAWKTCFTVRENWRLLLSVVAISRNCVAWPSGNGTDLLNRGWVKSLRRFDTCRYSLMEGRIGVLMPLEKVDGPKKL